jgi:RecB family exonuclease
LEGRSQATVEALRSTLAALDGLEAAFEQTAKSLGLSHRVPFAEFWRAAQAIMREMRPRIPDHRHNVVHVIDAYEARQWRVPIVFLCGLLEKQFPKYRAENPVLGDEVRLRLRRLGFRLSTAAESQQEEEFLFETAMTRADSELILSYPRFNRQGEENLPSFLLARVPARCENALAVRPRPGHEPAPLEGARIRRDEIRERIREKHTWFRPTALESFLQCPFQFFFRHTLALREAPRAPQDRLDVQLKGSIVHRTIARWHQARLPIREVFERVYEEERATKRLPEGYRVEAAWTDMLLMLESYEANPRLLDGWKVDVERPFELRLDSGARLRGRIDRLDISPEGSMVIYDFKTSGEQRVKELVAGHEDGRAIQGGLYLAALEGAAGMLYWSLRGEPSLQGWHIALAGLEECGESVVLEALREIRTASLERAGRAAASIASGVIDVQPLDPEGCRKCEARDVCRVAVVKKTKEAGGNG